MGKRWAEIPAPDQMKKASDAGSTGDVKGQQFIEPKMTLDLQIDQDAVNEAQGGQRSEY